MIRPAAPRDLPDLTAIYNHYVATSHATFDVDPFTADSRRAWFDRFDGDRYQCWVQDELGDIQGYACTQPFKPKAAYETSVEISIYLHPRSTGKGRARALYGRLLTALAERDLHRVYAVIALPNDASVALHVAFGFVEVGTLTEVGRKFGRYWDVLWMQRDL